MLAGFLTQLSPTRLENGAAYSGLNPPASINNQENLTDTLTGQPDKDKYSFETPFCLFVSGKK